MTITFKCGHPSIDLANDAKEAPVCPVCRERRIVRVKAPAPRFSGACKGPLVQR